MNHYDYIRAIEEEEEEEEEKEEEEKKRRRRRRRRKKKKKKKKERKKEEEGPSSVTLVMASHDFECEGGVTFLHSQTSAFDRLTRYDLMVIINGATVTTQCIGSLTALYCSDKKILKTQHYKFIQSKL